MKYYGFCPLSCIPVRADASEKSEMVNQLLFGETFEIIDQFKGWKFIRGSLDGYEGFVDEKQFVAISESQFLDSQKKTKRFPAQVISHVFYPDGSHLWITPACSLDILDEAGHLKVGNLMMSYSEKVISPKPNPTGSDIVDVAMKYLKSPYLWGGRSLMGIDCSGLVQNVFKINGTQLPRDASQQVRGGKTVFLISEAQPGDVAFFENENGEITHTGIIIQQDKILHASGFVKIDTIDHHGIFDKDRKKYTHNLRIIKRFLPDE